MGRKNYSIGIILVLIIVGVVFFGGGLTNAKSAIGSGFVQLVRGPTEWIQGLFKYQSITRNASSLALENAALRAEALFLESNSYRTQTDGQTLQHARVYSTYPFNNRDALSIAAGAAHDIAVGMPVVVEQYLFLGEIVQVNEKTSVVRTVFDPGLELPVRIGKNQIDALLIGGRTPRLTLISKDVVIDPGEIIYTATAGFPYGLTIGEIEVLLDTPGSGFQEGSMRLLYEPAALSEVSVILQ